MYDVGGSSVSDYYESKKILVDIMMKKYGITEIDLNDINIVKSKIRDINIEDILK